MDIHLLHNILIILHSASATLSFFVGSLLISSSKYPLNQRLFDLYWWTLVGMVLLLAGAILAYWAEYSALERIVFSGLLGLGIYMVYRAWNAKRLIRDQHNGWRQNYIEHIGFTLISLFEGFVIVSGLNSGLPGWLVAFIAILGVLLGRWSIGLAQRRAA